MGKFVELKCQNCGGQLKVDEDDIKVGHGFIIYRGRNTLTCQSCGTQFERNADLAEDKGSLGGDIVVGNISNCSGVAIGNGAVAAGAGGIAIGGNRRSGVIITGNSNIVIGGDITGGDSYTIINKR